MDGSQMPGCVEGLIDDDDLEVAQDRNEKLEKAIVEIRDLHAIIEKTVEIMRFKLEEALR